MRKIISSIIVLLFIIVPCYALTRYNRTQRINQTVYGDLTVNGDLTSSSLTTSTITVTSQCNFPSQSIDGADIKNNEITSTQLDDSISVSTLTVTEASNLQVVTVTVSADGSGDYNCDGSSDETEINSAITEVISKGGGIVHLKSGTYIIDGTINIDGSAVTLQGEGWSTIIEADTGANNTMINCGSGTKRYYIKLINFKLDGNNQHDAANQYGVYCTNTDYGFIEMLDVGYCGSGICVNGSDYMKLKNTNVYSTNQGDGITFQASCDYGLIKDCLIANTSVHSIYVDACAYNVVANNIIYNSGSNSIYLYGASHGCTATANIINISASSGISLWHASAAPDDCNLNGNVILTSGAYGIYIGATCDRTMLDGNNITNSTTADLSDNGIGSIIGAQSPVESKTAKWISQSTEPTTTQVPVNRFAFWHDTDDSKCYLCFNDTGTVKTVEMP